LNQTSTDIYLQPHSDDICFSLGVFAYKRHSGTLLTVFPISNYILLEPGAPTPSKEWITKTRMAEDAAFAKACGLENRLLELEGASELGQQPFNSRWVRENLQRIKSPLLDVLLKTSIAGGSSTVRPWLFCPCGIGGHIDHVAIRTLINQNFDQLSQRYRIGFYEDLHYASSAAARSVGINNLWQEARGRDLKRHVLALGDDAPKKLALLQIYKSQFLTIPSIEQYTPAVERVDPPHEAIWSDEPVESLQIG
jgi:LmbE family N-acetylglucosaminyl deacetylase